MTMLYADIVTNSLFLVFLHLIINEIHIIFLIYLLDYSLVLNS